jgi:hypothetical protein
MGFAKVRIPFHGLSAILDLPPGTPNASVE